MFNTTSQTLTIEEAGEALGISRWLAYEQARTGRIGGVPVLRVGRRLLVPRRALERVLSGEVLPLSESDTELIGGRK